MNSKDNVDYMFLENLLYIISSILFIVSICILAMDSGRVTNVELYNINSTTNDIKEKAEVLLIVFSTLFASLNTSNFLRKAKGNKVIIYPLFIASSSLLYITYLLISSIGAVEGSDAGVGFFIFFFVPISLIIMLISLIVGGILDSKNKDLSFGKPNHLFQAIGLVTTGLCSLFLIYYTTILPGLDTNITYEYELNAYISEINKFYNENKDSLCSGDSHCNLTDYIELDNITINGVEYTPNIDYISFRDGNLSADIIVNDTFYYFDDLTSTFKPLSVYKFWENNI